MEGIKHMTNHELGVIANAFCNCEKYERCADCPCDGILCSRDDFGYVRDFFLKEVARRLMEN